MKKLNKKELNINGILFNIYTENIDLLEKYFSNFIIPSSESITSIYNIYFNNDKSILESLIGVFNKKEATTLDTFANQVHYKEDNRYLIDTEDYMCIKSDDYNYKLFGTVKGLSWVIRELLIREMEDKGYFYMHGTGLQIYDKGILLLGNSGSGKTTLMTKLYDINTKEKLISNDRVFVKENKMLYYPLPVIYAIGTARNNTRLDEYFRRTNALEKRRGKDYLTCSDKAKCDVPLTDIPKIFDNVSNVDQNNIDLIIFPKISDTEEFNILDRKIAEEKLLETNFTPNDTENKRKEWLRYRHTTIEEIERRKRILNRYLIKNIPIIEMSYTKDTDSKYLDKVLKKVL